MIAIDCVVRDMAGDLRRGAAQSDELSMVLEAGAGSTVSLNLDQQDVMAMRRVGASLMIELRYERDVLIDRFFVDPDLPARLFLSSGGFLTEVLLCDSEEGLDAVLGATEQWSVAGVWDDLIFMGCSGMAGCKRGSALSDREALAPDDTRVPAGVTLTGTADEGSQVEVCLGTTTHAGEVDADGNWAIDFAIHEVPTENEQVEVTATFQDIEGTITTAKGTVDVVKLVRDFAFYDAVEGVAGEDVSAEAEVYGEIGAVAEAGFYDGVDDDVDAVFASDADFGEVHGQANVDDLDFAPEMAAFETPVSSDVSEEASDEKRTFSPAAQVSALVAKLKRGIAARKWSVLEQFVADRAPEPEMCAFMTDVPEAATGIDLGGQVEAGSTLIVMFEGIAHEAQVDEGGYWSVIIPPASIRPGQYTAALEVIATDADGQMERLEDTLLIDTIAVDGPVMVPDARGCDGRIAEYAPEAEMYEEELVAHSLPQASDHAEFETPQFRSYR